MRVTIASRIFSPEPAAASFRLAALADALDESGHDVTVLTSTSPLTAVAMVRPGVLIRRAPVLRDSAGYIRGYAQYMSFDLPVFFRLLFRRRPDVVVVEPPPTTGLVVRIACAILRVPYVYYAADIWSDASESAGVARPVVKVVRFLEKRALRGARQVIAVSTGVRDRVVEIAGIDRVSVVTNGIGTDIFTPDGRRIEGTPYAVYAGTTSEWQGADVFVRAMSIVTKSHPEARLIFLGQGSAWSTLRDLASDLGLDCVEFRGQLPPKEAAVWLRSATVGLVSIKPGQGYDFAIPTKIYAAVSSGTPVIYAGVGPAAEIVASNGLGVSSAYDTEAVADALISAFDSPADDVRRGALVEWARRHVSLENTGRSAAAVVTAERSVQD